MRSPTTMPTKETALPDREKPVETDKLHYVTRNPLAEPFPRGFEKALFAMGCFWGPEHMFWDVPGIRVTAVGYSGGLTANPTYEDVKSGLTGHAEVVRLVFDPKKITYPELLKLFWENHDPTTDMKQGVDEGTQYRSAIYYYNDDQRRQAELSLDVYQAELSKNGFGKITTRIEPAGEFYFAEGYHQAYFAKNPTQYCGMSGTGVNCPIGLSGRSVKPR